MSLGKRFLLRTKSCAIKFIRHSNRAVLLTSLQLSRRHFNPNLIDCTKPHRDAAPDQQTARHSIWEKELSANSSHRSTSVFVWLRRVERLKSHRNQFLEGEREKSLARVFWLNDGNCTTTKRSRWKWKTKCWKQSNRYSWLDFYKWFRGHGEKFYSM